MFSSSARFTSKAWGGGFPVVALLVGIAACGDDGGGDESASSSATGSASTGASSGSNAATSSGSSGASTSGGGGDDATSSSAASGGGGAGDGGGGAGGGVGGAGGSGGGAGGAPSVVTCETYEGNELCRVACADLPQTLEMGSTAAIDGSGAIVCLEKALADCYVTTNTFSDGPFACSGVLVGLFSDGASDERYLTTDSSRHFTATSHGTIEADFPYVVTAIPDATEITVAVNSGTEEAPGPDDYEVVITFDGGDVTVTSVLAL